MTSWDGTRYASFRLLRSWLITDLIISSKVISHIICQLVWCIYSGVGRGIIADGFCALGPRNFFMRNSGHNHRQRHSSLLFCSSVSSSNSSSIIKPGAMTSTELIASLQFLRRFDSLFTKAGEIKSFLDFMALRNSAGQKLPFSDFMTIRNSA